MQAFDQARKPIAAICHGPQILAAAGVLEDRKVIPSPACGPECTAAGAKFGEVNGTASNALTDGHLVTAPAWPATRPGCASSSSCSGRRSRPERAPWCRGAQPPRPSSHRPMLALQRSRSATSSASRSRV